MEWNIRAAKNMEFDLSNVIFRFIPFFLFYPGFDLRIVNQYVYDDEALIEDYLLGSM